MDYTKSSKADLLAALSTLEQEKVTALAAAEHNAKIAAWFQQVLESIEKLLVDSPFINTKGKFFKKLFWAISNFSTITTFIEAIVAQIKQWRDDVTKVQESMKSVNNTNS